MTLKFKEEEWEDMEFEPDTTQVAEDSDRRSVGSEPTTPRRRTQRKVQASSPLSKSPREKKLSHRTRPRTKEPTMRWTDAISSASMFTFTYVVEILHFALLILRKPLSLILVGYLLALLISHLHSTISTTLHSTLAPLCQLPGLSRVGLCRWTQPGGTAASAVPQRADYPKLVDIQSTTFERLLDDSVGGAGLALEIKKAELATTDLTTLVSISHLTSRERIAETLGTFVEDARRTGRGLQRFSAAVNTAVDSIIAMNDYALKRIEEAAFANSSPSLWRVLVPFTRQSSSDVALTTSFNQAMSILESELYTLILAAEASLHDLDELEGHLKALHTIVSFEDASLSTSKQELLSKLWTMVGGNRSKLRRYNSHSLLLEGLGEYRRKALAHVVGALQTLQTMSADLEALRQKVSRPALTASESTPLEVHVRSIREGLGRLTEGRLKAKQIEKANYAKLVIPTEG